VILIWFVLAVLGYVEARFKLSGEAPPDR